MTPDVDGSQLLPSLSIAAEISLSRATVPCRGKKVAGVKGASGLGTGDRGSEPAALDSRRSPIFTTSNFS